MKAAAIPTAPTVSVVMSVRDGGRYLRPAIDSILAQQFDDFEFLIVDDGSQDGSRAILAGYRDPRIRVLPNEHSLGLTRSLNRAIDQARGRYIARMDADDLSQPERLQRQVAFLELNPDHAVVASYVRIIGADDTDQGSVRPPLDPDDLARALRRDNRIAHGSVMLRRDVFVALGGYDETLERAQDYDLWLRISEHAKIGVIPENLYCWRTHPDNVRGQYRNEQDRDADRARQLARQRFAASIEQRVASGELTAQQAAEQVLRRRDDEGAPRAAGWLARLQRRLPGRVTPMSWLARYGPGREAARVLVECRAGRIDSATARDSLVTLIASGAKPLHEPRD